QLTDFTISVTEPATAHTATLGQMEKTTGIAPSVLHSGNWYKISVPGTGFFRVDYDFLTNSGINTSGITLNNIRVYGNGGNMLPENNAIPRPQDLVENNIWVVDNNGNGNFDKGDYFVFYAVGPTGWTKDSLHSKFSHVTNIYEDKAYYFLNFDQPGNGKRVPVQASVPTANETVNSFNAYALHEQELVNLGPYGREWWGEEYSSNPGRSLNGTISFNLGPVVSSLDIIATLGNVSTSGSNSFNVTLNGASLGNILLGEASGADQSVYEDGNEWNVPFSGSTANIGLTYNPGNSDAKGYLNYIEINYRRALTFTDAQMNFRDWNSVGAGKVAGYQVSGASGITQVWDVTNPLAPVRMQGVLSGSTYSFSQDASMLHEFAAMNNTSLPSPTFAGTVANQDLHSLGTADLIIVTYPDFADAANQIADFHRQYDKLRVAVATTTQIYNEFSSGSQDISAIRDFARMFYDNAGNDTTAMPKNLLLFGAASYDYKDRIGSNSNYVPTYESIESHDPINSFASDDFFGMLDSTEDINNTSIYNTLDVGVGRLPIYTVADAQNMVNKIKVYKSPAALGPWRISATFVADNEDDAGQHMTDAEDISKLVALKSKNLYNDTKVYVDAIPTISTPGGARCPNANQAIDNQVYKGTFMINYTGHGNTAVWASERVLTQDDYNNWNNLNALPFVITATCDFGQFDNPAVVSAGEQLVLKNNGGVIAAITTTQETYEGENKILDTSYVSLQFKHYANGDWNSFGDAFRMGKNITYSAHSDGLANYRKFSLLGDPALIPDFPKYFVHTDTIKDGVTGTVADSIKALGLYVVSGSVTDVDKNVLSNFNGELYVTIFDKPRTVGTITTINKTFSVQDNIIYKGKVTVVNGKFSYTFIAPKDINYTYGNGKISYYAANGETDAAGAEDSTVIVGGFSDHAVTENNPPIVRPYMNDTLFQNGGITGTNSLLYVQLYDETGINVSGNDVGHDLTAVLDGDIQNPYILNNSYQSLPNSYQRGYVSFPMQGLPVGKHTITVKAWDVNDNSGEGSISFEVVDSNVMRVENVTTYPNPFRDIIHFVFDHNHPDEQLDVEINIFNTSGALVRNLKQQIQTTGSRTDEITWDGTDNAGVKLMSGMYICRIKVATAKGIASMAYQKVVLIR
ncbi:MAG: type IX secretion system sortase PorU, partial [Flavipsychrobacter sp.]